MGRAKKGGFRVHRIMSGGRVSPSRVASRFIKRNANNSDHPNGQSLGRFAQCLDRYLAVDISGVLWYVDVQVYVVVVVEYIS